MEGMVAVHARVLGHQVTVLRKDIENVDEGQDPYFFEEVRAFPQRPASPCALTHLPRPQDYSVAASTAWLVWEGSWALIELLRREEDAWLRRLVAGKRVLELGAGTGLLGLAVAAAGGHCVLTDVHSMTEGSLRPNVQGNHTPPTRDTRAASAAPADTRLPGWTESGSMVGSLGSADVQALDWFKPVSSQRSPIDVTQAQVILAAECAWLAELVEPFVRTLVALLSEPHKPTCVFAFRERAGDASTAFVGRGAVLRRLEEAGCEVTWREGVEGAEGKEEAVGGNVTEVFLVTKR